MNKKAIIALVLVLLALLFGYFFLNKNSKVSNQSKTSTQVSSGSKSIKDLLSGGVSQKCTFKSDSSEGTVYTGSSKMRGDFTVTASGQKIVNHMIVDGNTSYMWVDGQKTGYKMSFDMTSDTSISSSPSSASTSEVDTNTKMDYDCSAWIIDSSVFVTPSDVKFTEFSVPTSAPASGGSSSGNSSQCSYCNNLTGDSKSQCLAALNCK
jgi:hypothetical protein